MFLLSVYISAFLFALLVGVLAEKAIDILKQKWVEYVCRNKNPLYWRKK